jgi:hypothetical protein
MKSCPKCNSTFPDFHHVCDFDGAELISLPGPLPPVNALPSCFRRIVKSPLFVDGVAAVGLLAITLSISYYNSIKKSQGVVKDQQALTSPAGAITDARAPEQPLTTIKESVAPTRAAIRNSNRLPRASFATLRRVATGRPVLARSYQTTSNRNELRQTEVAGQKGLQEDSREKRTTKVPVTKTGTVQRQDFTETSREKGSTLVAMLKTTWRVLKKPFKL